MNDCLIIGGGVIGLSLAYELAGHGLRVQVIDRSEPAQEASWAGAGILPPANRKTATHPLDQLRGLSAELHPVWAERLRAETGIDTGYRRCGGIYIARSSGEAASLHGLVGLLHEEQIAVEPLSPGQLAQLEPGLAPLATTDQIKAAFLLPDESQLRNPRHLKALLATCRGRGVEICDHAEALSFDIAGGRVRGVETNRGIFSPDRICLTSGAWTQRLLAQFGIANGVLPIRGQMILFACDAPPLGRIINEGPRYIVPRDDGRVLVGSTEEEVGFDKRTTDEALAELTTLARDLVPALRNATIEHSWAGLRPATFDGLPYLGQVPDLENTFVAAGHFRSGLFLSPATAVVMSQLLRGETPDIDLTPFRISRG